MVPTSTQLRITPGESITLLPYLYHDFSVEVGGGGTVPLIEVNQCNDDQSDNRF